MPPLLLSLPAVEAAGFLGPGLSSHASGRHGTHMHMYTRIPHFTLLWLNRPPDTTARLPQAMDAKTLVVGGTQGRGLGVGAKK